MALYGKVFHRVRNAIGGSKSTKEVVEFYYVWKKTSHGKRWKGSFAREITDSDSDGDDLLGAVGGGRHDDDGGGSDGRRSADGASAGVDGGGAAGGGRGKG